jgi:hypothetical protein
MEVIALIMALFAALLAVERKTERGEFTDTVEPLPIWSDYRSDGGLYLIRKGGERYFNTMWLHVCRTGDLEQFYTLYQEVMWYNGYSCNHSVVYCGNLAHDKDKALEKAYERAWSTIKTGMWHDVRVDFHKSPRRVSNTYYAFSDEDGNNGIEMKLSKSKEWYWGSINGNERFWGLWNEDKKAIKDAGFSISKKYGEWLLYMKAEVMNVDYDSETAIYEPEGYIPQK